MLVVVVAPGPTVSVVGAEAAPRSHGTWYRSARQVVFVEPCVIQFLMPGHQHQLVNRLLILFHVRAVLERLQDGCAGLEQAHGIDQPPGVEKDDVGINPKHVTELIR